MRKLYNHTPPAAIVKQAKETIEKNEGRPATDDEVSKMLDFMYFLAELSLEQMEDEAKRTEKLIEFPKGFPVERGDCGLCGRPTGLTNSWFDKLGTKCLACQKAVNMGIIPHSVVGEKDRFYTETELDNYFNLKGQVLTEWIRSKIIHARTVTNLNGKGKYFRLFLISDNKGFLPPLKMLDIGGYESFTIDGEQTDVYLHWYQLKDPFVYLKKYGIIKYLKRVEVDFPVEKVTTATAADSIVENFCAPSTFSLSFVNSSPQLKRRAKRKKME